MIDHQKQGLVQKQRLSEVDIAEIQQLAALCNHHENLRLPISTRMLRARLGYESNDFLYYQHGRLLGYVGLTDWGIVEREATGMVHPDWRHRGIFRLLLRATAEEHARRGVERLVLVCERASASGQSCMKALGAQLNHSEHEMILASFKETFAFDERLIFRQATMDDLCALVKVQSSSFNESSEMARQKTLQRLQDSRCRIFLATFGEEAVGCEEPVGILRIHDFGEESGIYGFGIISDYRGRGFGRQMLEEAICLLRAEHAQKPIMLNVETDNTRAFELYHSSGFVIRSTYDYYCIPMETLQNLPAPTIG